MLSLAGKTDAEIGSIFRSSGQLPEELCRQYAEANGGVHTNGAIYRVTFGADTDTGSGTLTTSIAFVDRYGIAPGTVNGPTAKAFTFTYECLRRDVGTAYYTLAHSATGSLVDGTYGNQKASTTNRRRDFLPMSKFKTSTAGIEVIALARFDSADVANPATLTTAAPFVGKIDCDLVQPAVAWAVNHLPLDFD